MNLNLTTLTRYGLNVLAALGASIALFFGRPIFIPLTIALLLAPVLWPGAHKLRYRFGLPWFLSCAVVVALLVITTLIIFALVGVSIPQMLNDLPRPNDDASMQESYTRMRTQCRDSLPFLDSTTINSIMPVSSQDSGLYREIRKFFGSEQFTSFLLNAGGQGLHLLTDCVLVLFILYFLLIEGGMLAAKVRNIFGTGLQTQSNVSAAFQQIAESVRAYMVWRTIINLALGLFLGVFYYLIGLQKHAVLWGLLTIVFCYIPYLGTIAAGVLPVLDAMINVSPVMALGVSIFYMLVVTVEGYILVPWMMGRSMDLNATTVLISCLYWYLVWGTAGLFLAMPIMAAIKAVCAQVPGWEAWGSLMGSRDHKSAANEPTPSVSEQATPIIDLVPGTSKHEPQRL